MNDRMTMIKTTLDLATLGPVIPVIVLQRVTAATAGAEQLKGRPGAGTQELLAAPSRRRGWYS